MSAKKVIPIIVIALGAIMVIAMLVVFNPLGQQPQDEEDDKNGDEKPKGARKAR